MYSSASQLRTSFDRLIFLMVRLPALKSSFNLCGHSSLQMTGLILFRPDV